MCNESLFEVSINISGIPYIVSFYKYPFFEKSEYLYFLFQNQCELYCFELDEMSIWFDVCQQIKI